MCCYWVLSVIIFFFFVVEFDGIYVNDIKEGFILIGEEGMKIVKIIRSWIIIVVDNGNFSLIINGIKFVVDGNLFNFLKFK